MRNILARFGIAGALLTMLLGLAACSGQDDLHQWVAEQKAQKGAPLPPLPVIKTFETFVYQDQDKRDPFSPGPTEVASSLNGPGPHPDQNRVREPLESFPLDSLKMVGTIDDKGGIEALIKDPQGVIHPVHVGNYLGQNYGHVTGISEDHVALVELVPNGSGGWMERDASIALGDK
ncbi:MAG: pilus assembly protein PilP [Rhodanobacteraceae bacterium]